MVQATAAGPALLFGLRLWASVCLSLYVAFWLELDNAFWAGASAAIVCQPQLGASLRKAWFLMIGTLVGATASVVLAACFVQNRVGFLTALAIVGAASAFLATILRNFASYSAALAGFTVAIIAADILGATGGATQNVFTFAVARAGEITVGIVCSAVVLAGTDLGGAQRRLAASFAASIAEIGARFADMLMRAGPEMPETLPIRRKLLRQAIALDPIIDQAIGESSELRAQSTVLQTAVDGLLAALSGWRAIAVRLARPPHDRARREAQEVIRSIPHDLCSALISGDSGTWIAEPARLQKLIESSVRMLCAAPLSTPSVLLLNGVTAKVLTGISDALSALALLTAVRARPQSCRRSFWQYVPDWLPAFLSAGRAFLAIGAAALFWIATAWPNGAFAITFAAIVVTLLAPTRDHVPAVSLSFMIGTALAAVFAGIIKFAALPAVDTFAGFSVIIGLYLVPVGALSAQPWQRTMFTAMALWFVAILAPTNQMTYDTIQFYNYALAIVLGSGIGVLSFYMLPPLSPAVRTQRLLALTLRDLRRLAAGSLRRTSEEWEARLFSRLAVLPDGAQPVQRSQLLTALFVGAEIIRLRHAASHLGLGQDCSAAFADLARASGANAVERLAGIDRHLASLPESSDSLRARASLLAISDALAEHAAYFDAGAPG
jgi:uncharacterized membrane protein YccC